MPEVYNWQLGRKMLYPYEERHPKWQFAFVFNINRCIACQTCSMADKSTWLFSKGQEDETFFFYLQRICNHCTYPGCLAACPRKAIYKRPEDGIVLIDQNRCRGYKKCVEQCPYKKPMYRGTTRVSEKCIACYPRVEGKDPLTGGEPMETRCMAACVGKIRMQGLNRIGEDGLWAEPGAAGGAAAVAGEPADHLPVRRDSGAEGVRDPDSRAQVRDVQRHGAGVQQVGQGDRAHPGGGADLHPSGGARHLVVKEGRKGGR